MYRPKQAESLFATEFSVIPECLTKSREMCHGNKSLLLHAYDPDPSTKQTIQPNAIVIDISVVIRSQTANTTAYTFDDFTTEVIKTLVTLAKGCSRIDIVTDSFFNISLKADTRLSRGIGQFLPFEPRTPIPKDFKDNFFSNSRNKHAFNAFLTKKLLEYDFGNVKIVVSVDDVILSNTTYLDLEICDVTNAALQEEADTKIIAHILNCCNFEHRKLVVKTVDTDVITLIIINNNNNNNNSLPFFFQTSTRN